MTRSTLQQPALAALLAPTLARLEADNRALASRFAGERPGRQPVHTVYGGAHLFRADAAAKFGRIALATMAEYTPDFVAFAHALGLPGHLELPDEPAALPRLIDRIEREPDAVRAERPALFRCHRVHARVLAKLSEEPVEDMRIDFEDGYGVRPDAEEDAHAEAAAREVARGMQEHALPPFLGIRIKPLNEEMRARSLRTLDLFLSALAAEGRGLPPNFAVTLPKVTSPAQVEALAVVLDALERSLGLPEGAARIEIMIETPQSIVAPGGALAPLSLVEASRGRCVGAHFGTYDYTASCGISALHQAMDHPACDFARSALQASLAGTGVFLSDGATTTLPVPAHRRAAGAPPLSSAQQDDNADAMRRGFRLHHENIRASLSRGYYQSWDLHPAQLPVRFAATFAFFLEGADAAAARLRHFVDRAAQATRVGAVFDDAATGQGLLNFFLRAVSSGALSADEAAALSGLDLDDLRTRSFAAIAARRPLAAPKVPPA